MLSPAGVKCPLGGAVPQVPRHGQCVQVSLSFVGPLLYSPGHTAQALNHTRSFPPQGLGVGGPGGALPVWQGNVSPRTQPRAPSTLFPSLSGSNCHLDTCRVPEVPRYGGHLFGLFLGLFPSK